MHPFHRNRFLHDAGQLCAGCAAAVATLALLSALVSCSAVGGIIENYRRESNKTVEPEYTDLAGKNFAVVVAADRSIQAQHPLLAETLTNRLTARLSDPKNKPKAGGFVPAAQVAAYQYKNPGWAGKSLSELARELGGVQRLVYVEVSEFRLNEPGNQYEWDGAASARVAVAEVDSLMPDDYAFQKTLTVAFPDQKGVSTADMPQNLVTSALVQRIVDRASWIFYQHEEPYYPKY